MAKKEVYMRIYESYKKHGNLSQLTDIDWDDINVFEFGNIMQDDSDEDVRSQLGQHFTDEEVILKVLNPLFLDELRSELKEIKEKVDEIQCRKKEKEYIN